MTPPDLDELKARLVALEKHSAASHQKIEDLQKHLMALTKAFLLLGHKTKPPEPIETRKEAK